MKYGILLCCAFFSQSLLAKDEVLLFPESDGYGEYVSVVSLISSPERFHGRKVRIKGCFSFIFEDVSLYLSCEDYKYERMMNRVGLDFYGFGKVNPEKWGAVKAALKKFNGKPVEIVGYFKYRPNEIFMKISVYKIEAVVLGVELRNPLIFRPR